MATFLYINADPASGPQRATQLGCGWVAQTPPQFASAVTVVPAVVVAGQGVITVIPDTPPTTTAAVAIAAAPILAAEQAAASAAVTMSTNKTALQAAVAGRISTVEAFIAANPGGAVLTGPQTITLAKMLVGLARVVLDLTSTPGQGG